MKTANFLILLCVVLSCDSLSDDFFSVLLDSDSIKLTRICANNPPIFSDGRFIEQYEVSQETQRDFLARFSDNLTDTLEIPAAGDTYFKSYTKYLTWRKTPVRDEDSIVFQLSDDVGEETLKCYEISEIIRLLKTKGSYYAFFYETSGALVSDYKFYLIDPATHRLYVLTSYP